MLELKQITKLYGPVIGVNDITLSLDIGGYGLIGPNGSGKSTLLNLITGQLRPTLGTVRVFGGLPWNNVDVLRRIGVCPELDVLYGNVSALDWVSYLMELHGFARTEAKERATKALEQVAMGQAMRRPMGGYSRGMRQRTKLAQAFAHDPDLLILDEPFGGLDPIGRSQMATLLREWIASGKGLLLASHILHEVEAITPAFLLICGGRLLASGSAEDVHALLADLPNEIRIRCDAPSRLAHRMIDEQAIESLQIIDGELLIVATRSPATLYAKLPTWLEAAEVCVTELRSNDESLERLFNSLLQIHRGAI